MADDEIQEAITDATLRAAADAMAEGEFDVVERHAQNQLRINQLVATFRDANDPNGEVFIPMVLSIPEDAHTDIIMALIAEVAMYRQMSEHLTKIARGRRADEDK